jgi:hypothetical protein
MMYRSLDKMADEKVNQVKTDAAAFFANLDKGVV